MTSSVMHFQCDPDGLVLEHVSIPAGSADLRALDGTFRPNHVGKHIAIPGAVDLVATLTKFPKPNMETAKASMVAGQNVLTAVDGDFRRRAHRNMRITVAGAETPGGTLLTDVDEVIDDTQLMLADAAVTTVQGAIAKLNMPDRVRLGDYSRAVTGQLTVPLIDRTLTDARIMIGDDILSSPTARFSSLDLGQQVTLQAAGWLLTTIQAVHSDTEVTLAAAAQRAVDDGIAEVWDPACDSRPGLENLLASLHNQPVEAAVLEFGPGVYDFTRPVPASTALKAAIALNGRHNLMLRGAGSGVTVLRLMPDQDLSQGDANVLQARNSSHVTVRDLTIHGAYLTMRSAGDPIHGVHLAEGCQDIVLDQVDVVQSGGDGIRLLGSSERKVQRVWIDGCRLIRNHRTGIAFQRAIEMVWVRGCYIDMTPPGRLACIDFEPTGSAESGGLLSARDVIIDSNILIHGNDAVAVSISGLDAADPVRRVRFTNNTLHGGGIGGVYSQDVTIAGNTIVAGASGQVARFSASMDGIRLEANKITAADGQRAAIEVAQLHAIHPSHVRIIGNDIDTPGVGILLEGPGSFIDVAHNRIIGHRSAVGISVNLPKLPPGMSGTIHRGIRITGNTILNFASAGIEISTETTSEQYQDLQVSRNGIHVDPEPTINGIIGIRFPPPDNGTARWLGAALVADNQISDAVDIKIERDGTTVPFLVTSGNPGGRAHFEGDGEPNDVGVVAQPGSTFLRCDEQGPSALYLKAIGSGGTGWVELAQATT
jgi:hypothetical protein